MLTLEQRRYYNDGKAWRMAFKARRLTDTALDLWQLYRMVGGGRGGFSTTPSKPTGPTTSGGSRNLG